MTFFKMYFLFTYNYFTLFFSVSVWSLKTGELLNTLIHHCEAVLHLRFNDGIMVTCSKARLFYFV